MKLTEQQQRSLESGQAVKVTISGQACVLLRQDIYDRVERVLGYDDGPLTESQRRLLLQRAGERAGWDDPEMDVYDDLDPRKA